MSNSTHAHSKSQAHPLINPNQISDYLGRIKESFEVAAKRDFRLQLVIVKVDKTPLMYRWNKKHPNMDTISKCVQKRGCMVAFVPASGGRGVIDMDAGPMHVIGDYKKPIASLPSLNGRGLHNYYYADKFIKNRNIKPGQLTEPGMEEIACDIIYNNKYVVLSPQGIDQFPLVLDCNNPEDYAFPHELIPQATKYTPPPPNAPEYIRQIKGVDTPMKGNQIYMEEVTPRNRNNSLFHVLCRGNERGRKELKAGRVNSQDDLVKMAFEENAKLRIPLSSGEVIKTARSAWKYLLLDGKGGVGRDHYRHDPELQRQRAYIRADKWNAAREPQKQKAFELRSQGVAVKVIAEKVGIPAKTLYRWFKKEPRIL